MKSPAIAGAATSGICALLFLSLPPTFQAKCISLFSKNDNTDIDNTKIPSGRLSYICIYIFNISQRRVRNFSELNFDIFPTRFKVVFVNKFVRVHLILIKHLI